MRVAIAVLADAANVREGTLSILSAGINTTWRPEYPALLQAVLALLIEIPQEDQIDSFELEVSFRRLDGGSTDPLPIGSAKVESEGITDGGPANVVPLVLGLEGFEIPAAGSYQFELYGP